MPVPIDPVAKTVADLANDLTLAVDPAEGPEQGRGGAIFLVGAGCSVTAGIPAAPDVARHCALHLAHKYSRGEFTDNEADGALEWLVKNSRVELPGDFTLEEDGSHWANLYSYFFEAHLKSPNQQRDIINEIIDSAKDGLNWAHACLGELVERRYVHTVLTTNFDQLVLQGIIRTGLLPVTADGLEALNRITGKPKRPQVVHLHGSMHTYNLRNSRAALTETSRDSGAVSMIHSLLQQCELLVVVGYGGREEGVMELLRDAAKTLPRLVIYWVTYEQGHENLSASARELLSGENKFTIWGGSADKFFGDLMAELRIGQPRWVANPIAVLKEQSERLCAPEAELEDVRILVGAFKERVAFADRPENRWHEEGEKKVRAAEKRARREYKAAQDLLEQIDLSKDLDAARMHALNLHDMFEQDPINGGRILDDAIIEFDKLIEKSTGEQRLDNVISLCAALYDKSEFSPQETSDQALRRIAELARRWLSAYPPEITASGNARLNLFLAQALQIPGERAEGDLALSESEDAFNRAISGFLASGNPGGLLTDAKSGLAGVLQVRGEKTKDPEVLRRAVTLHRELVKVSRGGERSTEEAGPFENLAGSLVALAKLTRPDEAAALYREAKDALERAIRIYEHRGQKEQELLARERLETIEAEISGKEK